MAKGSDEIDSNTHMTLDLLGDGRYECYKVLFVNGKAADKLVKLERVSLSVVPIGIRERPNTAHIDVADADADDDYCLSLSRHPCG